MRDSKTFDTADKTFSQRIIYIRFILIITVLLLHWIIYSRHYIRIAWYKTSNIAPLCCSNPTKYPFLWKVNMAHWTYATQRVRALLEKAETLNLAFDIDVEFISCMLHIGYWRVRKRLNEALLQHKAMLLLIETSDRSQRFMVVCSI